MTNQVNQEFEKWFESQYNHKPKENNGVYMTMFADGASKGYQAATQASESEINSLKQRVEELEDAKKDLEDEVIFKNVLISTKRKDVLDITDSFLQRVKELQADNLRLREALERIVKAEDNVYNCEDDYQGDVIGKLSDIHFKAYNKARKVLSSTPVQSLAEHELIKSQRDKLLASLKLALIEMLALPSSLGLEITHTIDMELLIKEVEESK